MGKLSQQQLPVTRQQQGASWGRAAGVGGSRIFCCQRCSTALSTIVQQFNFKCVFVLMLCVAASIFALFSVMHLHSKNYGYDAKESIKLSATIQANFILQKPVSQLVPHVTELEYEIFEEIGVPSTKVVILSMHQTGASNITNVVFGVLSASRKVPINPVLSTLLKSSFVELFLQEYNLTLTNTTFGQPSSFDILKFPGGITLIPVQLSPIRQIPQILFNFTLNNSVEEIKSNFVELKRQLKLGLDLMPYENVYLQVTNKKGSTRDAPVVVETSITSYFGLPLPQRLKELAETIIASPAKNLGLDTFVFGKVKEVRLSSSLNCSFDALPPSPSPSPSSTPVPSPSLPFPQSDPPASAPNFHNLSPSSNCDAPAPSDPSHANAPSPQDQHRHHSPTIPSPPPHALPSISTSSSLDSFQKIWWISLFGLFASHLLSCRI